MRYFLVNDFISGNTFAISAVQKINYWHGFGAAV